MHLKADLIGVFFSILFYSCNNTRIAKKTPKVFDHASEAKIEILSPLEHDFGIYHKKETKSCWFVYKNTGKKPLIIQHVVADCGCTTVQFSKKPLLPGLVDSLKVIYDGNGFLNGSFRKTISITCNGSAIPVEIHIKGEYYELQEL